MGFKSKLIGSILVFLGLAGVAVPHIGSLLDFELFMNLNLPYHPIAMLVASGVILIGFLMVLFSGSKK